MNINVLKDALLALKGLSEFFKSLNSLGIDALNNTDLDSSYNALCHLITTFSPGFTEDDYALHKEYYEWVEDVAMDYEDGDITLEEAINAITRPHFDE